MQEGHKYSGNYLSYPKEILEHFLEDEQAEHKINDDNLNEKNYHQKLKEALMKSDIAYKQSQDTILIIYRLEKAIKRCKVISYIAISISIVCLAIIITV